MKLNPWLRAHLIRLGPPRVILLLISSKLADLHPLMGVLCHHIHRFSSHSDCFCSVTKSCLTLWNPMDGSMTGFPVLHYFPEFAQTFMSTESVMSSNHPVLFRPLLLLPSIIPSTRVFSNESHWVPKVLELQLQYQSFQ